MAEEGSDSLRSPAITSGAATLSRAVSMAGAIVRTPLAGFDPSQNFYISAFNEHCAVAPINLFLLREGVTHCFAARP